MSSGRLCIPVWSWVLWGVLASAGMAAEEAEQEEYLGPCEVAASRDGKTLYVACVDARQVAWVALPEGKVTRRVDLPAEPTGLVLGPGGGKLFVTCGAPKSTVAVIDVASGEVTARIAAGHTAMGPAVSPDGKRLYVCNRFDGDVSVIDLAAGKEVARVKAVREPVAAAVTPDGKAVLVANHLPNTRTDAFSAEPVAPVVTVIDTQTRKSTAIELATGSMGIRALRVSPDGKRAYVTHLLCNFQLTPTQLDMGWVNANVLSVIDVAQKKLVNTVGLDEVYQGSGNPWGVATTADGKTICVAHAGSYELSVIDAKGASGTLVQMFISPLIGVIPDDPAAGMRPPRRIKLPGKGARGLAVVGSKVYVAEYFSDALSVVDLEAKEGAKPGTIRLGPEPKLSVRRRGEMLFNDATICYQRWQSCASCHPDGRTDGLNWDLMNDGMGNFKSTKSLVLAESTPPMMAEGVRASAEEAVRAGLESILFAYRPKEETAAILEYVKSLRPVPSPHLVDGRLSPAAERGKRLFESDRVGCSKCHPAPLYTDRKSHDVGTKPPFGFTDRFDTPTLVEVWRTAPYLHDGRYKTVRDVIAEGKHGKSRGRVEELGKQEIDDLVEFVLSL